MERMPYTVEMDAAMQREGIVSSAPTPSVASEQWEAAVPVLAGSKLTLRELRMSDAASLFMLLTTEEVTRFISPPPTSVEGFERFIAWAQRERAASNYVCFAIVPVGSETAVGLFQLRKLEADWETAEWGFALGSPYWGTGLFAEGSDLVLRFAFETVGVHRLEARAAVRNGRGSGALRKAGAVQEGVLRRSFFRNGEHLDQILWAILKEDWLQAKVIWGPNVH